MKALCKLKQLLRLAAIFFIGYIIGSIHAPFKVEWRTDDALPDVSPASGDYDYSTGFESD